MIGNHGYLVILDTYIKGVRQFNITAAYKAMKEEVSDNKLHFINKMVAVERYADLTSLPSWLV